MRLGDLMDGLPGAAGEIEIAGLASDSREVTPGVLFAALTGAEQDGARFVPQALEAGAAAVLARPEAAKARAAAKASGVPFIEDANPRRRLALMAARLSGRQPGVVAAVTGTNGKTSVASFLRQIWTALGHCAGSIGTLGYHGPGGLEPGSLTTPDPIALHRLLARACDEGVTHLAFEASSHGLAQHRVDGVRIQAAAITNVTRDHLDYHASYEDYLYAKLRLFGEILPPGGVAVVNVDDAGAARAEAIAWARGCRAMEIGGRATDLRLLRIAPHGRGQRLRLRFEERERDVELPLMGGFQASNALIAAGLAIGCGASADAVFDALQGLEGAPGRLELVARAGSGADIVVDYAHTPDAIATALAALRPHATGAITIVIGAGGDRDPGKRPLMGAAAAKGADRVIVTDDNPRSEDPALIRAAMREGAPEAEEIGERAEAIRAGVAGLGPGDLLLIAGKGHEPGQEIAGVVRPFDDREEARRAVAELEALRSARRLAV